MTSSTDATTAADAPRAAEYVVVPSSQPHTTAERAAALEKLSFGSEFTDHMVRVSWTVDGGWRGHRVEAFGPISLSPAASVLHYAQEIFEGLKAYRHADGSVWAFRPEANAERFNRSARRMAMPELPVEDFLGSIRALVETDLEWVPASEGASLYLRPMMIATEPFLGVRPAHQFEYMLIASPVGPYFVRGFEPVSIWVEDSYHRSGPGGTGSAKFGGNYAASLLPQQKASEKGFEQVCFLDAGTGANIEELGGMNVFVVGDDGVVHTPALTGSILEGVTRSSIIGLLQERGVEVVESDIPLRGLLAGIGDGSIAEVFACGTAAVITPIGRLASDDFDVTVGDGTAGPTTTLLYEQLTDIQFGRATDSHGWMHRLV